MTDPIDTARQEGIALGLAMAKAIADEIQAISDAASGETSTGPHSYGAGYDAGERAVIHHFAVELEAQAPIPPHVAAARVLLDAPDTLAAAMVDWARDNQLRLRQIQGFGYGSDGLRFTVRDCWRRNDQVIWQKQSSPETHDADHAEMTRQIDLRCMLLILTAALEQIAKEGE